LRGIFFSYYLDWHEITIQNMDSVHSESEMVEIQPDPSYYLDPSIPAEDLTIAYKVLDRQIRYGHTKAQHEYYPNHVSLIDIQRAIASNPNTPTKILVLAAKEYPAAILSNPVFSFLLMERLKQFPSEAIYNLSVAARCADMHNEEKLLMQIYMERRPSYKGLIMTPQSPTPFWADFINDNQ
jgi:hypothetical protein